jgi:hypothetical protein
MDKPRDPKPPKGRRFIQLKAWKGQPLHVDPAHVQAVLQHDLTDGACYVYLANGQSPQVAMSADAVLAALGEVKG